MSTTVCNYEVRCDKCNEETERRDGVGSVIVKHDG